VQWSRPEQAVVLLALCATLAGGAWLMILRRPTAPVRVIEQPIPSFLVVQVDGAVVRSGLHRLPAGSRVIDALDAAGGITPDAELSDLNLARTVRDGERITVPSRLAGPAAVPGPGRVVHINSATAEQLETLPGIGPVLAHRIIEYRTRHGAIRRLDDLLRIEGIGPRAVERLRPLVVVD
jgi:competence protein ComEA